MSETRNRSRLPFPYVSVFLHGRIFAEPAIHSETHHAKERFTEYATAHLASTFSAVYENYRYFLYVKPYLMSCKLHLYLECITFETYLIQFYRLQYTTLVTYKSSCRVMYLETCDFLNIDRKSVV